MRVIKALLVLMPLKLVWLRITSSKWTLAFFWTAVAHCLLQLGLESYAFANNLLAIDELSGIIAAGRGQMDSSNLGIASFQNGNLSVCQGLPGASDCKVVWSAGSTIMVPVRYDDKTASRVSTSTATLSSSAVVQASTTTSIKVKIEDVPSVSPPLVTFDRASTLAAAASSTPSVASSAPSDDEDEDEDSSDNDLVRSTVTKRSVSPTHDDAGKFVGVTITGDRFPDGSFLASPSCISSLQVPNLNLVNSQRVDVTFLSYQLWLFGMSLVALLNESVPHIIAAFLTHVFATLWSGYQVYLTHKFRQDFGRLVIQGPCKTNLLPNYWDPRERTEITILALNVVMTCVVAVLSYKLLKAFGWQTFKKIGASWAINRCYQLVLAFSITIQLAVFFVGANIALWLDQLCHGFISPYAEHRKVYEGVYITALVILIPWLAVGWFAVRKESRVWMAVFLGVAIVMIIGWASMFASRMLRWTFRVWDFFAFMTVAAAVLLVAAISLGVVCRINFGKGLPQYLVTDELGAEPSWEPAMESTYGDEEKLVKFPSETSPHPVPTFSDAFVGPEGLDRLRAMSRPAARSGPGIGMHARGTSTSGSVDFMGGLPTRPDVAVTITRSASTASRSTLSSFESPTGQPVMNATDPRMTSLTRINTSESYRSASSQNSGLSAGSRMNRNHRWAIDE